MTSLTRRLADRLAGDGHVRLGRDFFDCPDHETAVAREAFLALCGDLPADPYAGGANRRRRYGTFILLPWSGTLESVPPVRDPIRNILVSRYVQTAGLNPEQNGHVRSFAALTAEQAGNRFLRWLIGRTFELVAAHFTGQPVWVGCHIIRLTAAPAQPVKSSPDLVHCDGEPFTMAVLLERTGVVGGESLITTAAMHGRHPSQVEAGAILARFTLAAPWEGWMVSDAKVAHYASPIEVEAGKRIGSRTVLLVDFTPLHPVPLADRRPLPAASRAPVAP